jgi:bifunctional DNA-binding transcriptional regulator/antitoxin component of YhaV-PrlF toxin-antitoxin module
LPLSERLATALLHRENSNAADFSVHEIIEKASVEKLVKGYRPGLQVHTSKHCVANKAPNPGRHRILFETTRGRRRLFKKGDPFHPDREGGKIRPDRTDLPLEYQPLVNWYDEVYTKQSVNPSSAASPASVNVPHQYPPDQTAAFAGFEEMRSATAFVGPRGTVVLPEYLQQELGLKEGSCLSIYRDKERVVLLPINDEYIRRLCGKRNLRLSWLREPPLGVNIHSLIPPCHHSFAPLHQPRRPFRIVRLRSE